jgi:hypothetical protein
MAATAMQIARVRLLIADPAGESQVFSDGDIEATLAEHEISDGEYDVYGAAAELLEMWAAREKLSFDFSADGAQYRRSQKVANLLDLAAQFRRRQQVQVIRQVRGDIQ